MKILNKLKSLFDILWSEHFTFPLRMTIVFMIIRYFFIDEYVFKSEIETALLYLFGFFLLYTVTSVLNLKTANSSPFFLSDFIEKKINNDYYMEGILTLNDKRGIYVRHTRFEGLKSIATFHLHDDPAFVKGRASAYSYVLSSMQLPSHEKK